MAARVEADDVMKLLGSCSVDIQIAIDIANDVVNEYLAGIGISDTMLSRIELFLAAHFGAIMSVDGALISQHLSDAGEKYADIYGPGLQSTRFGQTAISLDPTGTLADMAKQAADPKLKALFTNVGDPQRDNLYEDEV